MDEYDSSDIRRLASILGGSHVEYVSLPEKKKKTDSQLYTGMDTFYLFIYLKHKDTSERFWLLQRHKIHEIHSDIWKIHTL